jgi:hypothetical protein
MVDGFASVYFPRVSGVRQGCPWAPMLSTRPLILASVKTLVVSWKEAVEIKLSARVNSMNSFLNILN